MQQDGSSNTVVDNVSFGTGSIDLGSQNVSMNATGLDNPPLLQQEPDLFNPSSVGSMSDLESLFESTNGLIWNDLFDTTFDMSMPLIHDQLHDQHYSDPLSLLAHVADQPQGHGIATQSLDYRFSPDQFHDKQSLHTSTLR